VVAIVVHQVVVVDHHIPLRPPPLPGKTSIFNHSFLNIFSSVHLDHLVQRPHPVDPGKIRLLIPHRSFCMNSYLFLHMIFYSNNALDQDQEVDQNVVHHL
jgi:hypothetical protein